MNLSLFLFLIGILGFVLNRKNIILMIIAIEIMLLAVTLLVLISSFSFDDGVGQTFSIYIISIAGAESVIGLSILVSYYRLTFYLKSLCLFRNIKIYFKPSLNVKNNFNSLISSRNFSITRKISLDVNNNSLTFVINPWFVTGLYDAESSFVVIILKNSRYKTGWNVQARVQLKMRPASGEKDRNLLLSIQEFFGCASARNRKYF